MSEDRSKLEEAIKASATMLNMMPDHQRELLFSKLALADTGSLAIDKKTFIYVDLACIVDLYIGAILHHALMSDRENYINVSKIITDALDTKEYKTRFIDDVERQFKDTGYTYEQIEKVLNESSLHDLAMHAPVTNCIRYMEELADRIVPVFLKQKSKDATEYLGIIVNMYDPSNSIQKPYRSMICKILSSTLNTTDIRVVTSLPTCKYLSEEKNVKACIGFFIKDMKAFVEEPSIKKMFEEDRPDTDSIELPFTNKYIFGYRTIHSRDKISQFKDEEFIHHYLDEYSRVYMSFMTNFQYFLTEPFVQGLDE